MAEQDVDGNWRSEDGRVHQFKEDAMNADRGGSGGGGGGFLGGGGAIAMFGAIFIFGPIIVAKLVGLIWGLLLKLPTVGKVNIGKIITTVLMIPAGVFIVVVLGVFLSEGIHIPKYVGYINVAYLLIIGAVFIIPAWYFCWHYDVVKAMGASVFSEKIKKFAMFIWFGYIGAGIIMLAKGEAVGGVLACIISIVAVAYYILSTRSYASEVREQNRNASKAWKPIVMLVAVGLTALITVQNAVSDIMHEAELTALYAVGNTVFTMEDTRLFKDETYQSVVATIPTGTRLTILEKKDRGEIVEYNGVKGIINANTTFPVMGTATLLEDVTYSSTTFRKDDTVTIGNTYGKGGNLEYVVMDSNGNFGRVNAKKLKIDKK